MPKVKIAVPHALGKDDALERIKTYGDKVRAKFEDSVKNLEETWEDNKCNFAFRTYGMDFSGSMTVNDSDVEVDGNLPFAAMMFKGRIEKEVQGELDKLLA